MVVSAVSVKLKMDAKYDDIMDKIEDLISLRKDAPISILRVHENITNLKLKDLKNIKIDLENIKFFSDIKDIVEKCVTENRKDYEYEKKLYELHNLLELNTNISTLQKIIDDI